MKKLIFLIVTFLLMTAACFAQDASGVPSVVTEALGFAKPLLEALLGKYGWLVQVFAWIAMLRVLFKPIMTLVQTVVSLTPTVDDDAFVAKIMNHWIYKTFAFLLDWSASIKLPQVPKDENA